GAVTVQRPERLRVPLRLQHQPADRGDNAGVAGRVDQRPDHSLTLFPAWGHGRAPMPPAALSIPPNFRKPRLAARRAAVLQCCRLRPALLAENHTPGPGPVLSGPA